MWPWGIQPRLNNKFVFELGQLSLGNGFPIQIGISGVFQESASFARSSTTPMNSGLNPGASTAQIVVSKRAISQRIPENVMWWNMAMHTDTAAPPGSGNQVTDTLRNDMSVYHTYIILDMVRMTIKMYISLTFPAKCWVSCALIFHSI